MKFTAISGIVMSPAGGFGGDYAAPARGVHGTMQRPPSGANAAGAMGGGFDAAGCAEAMGGDAAIRRPGPCGSTRAEYLVAERMTCAGKGGAVPTAEVKSIAFNPEIGDE